MLASNINEAFLSLYAAKQRTILALLGIVIGVGSVIAMISVGLLTQHESLQRYMEIGIDLVGIHRSREAEQDAPKLTLKSARLLSKQTKTLRYVSPVVKNWVSASFQGKEGYAGLIGVDEDFPKLNNLKLKKGRFLTKLDRYHNFAVLMPHSLYLEDEGTISNTEDAVDLIGKKIRVGDDLVTIIGIIEESDSIAYSVVRYNVNYYMLVPTRLAQRLAAVNGIDLIVARLQKGVSFARARKEIEHLLARHARGVPLEIKNSYELIKEQQKQALIFTAMLGAIGGISLLVGGIGVMNVMLVSVSERRREIGIRRALGASRGDIQSQFLIEAIILSLLGGIIGALLGVGSSWLYAHYKEMEFMVSYGAIGLGVGFSSIVGIFFGFYPAWKASRLDPITALRSE
jgi:putative ABC transport system permease protein